MRKILMPEVGSPASNQIVLQWYKSVGEAVAKGDLLVRVEGSAGAADLESADAGVLTNIFAHVGTSLPVGAAIAEISEAEAQTSQTPAPAKTEILSTSSAFIPVLMPQAGNSMEEGTIVKWHVKEGDRIKKGQVIFEIETDKANMEVEASDDGRIAKILIPVGGVQKVKEPVAYLGEGQVAEQPQQAASPVPTQPVQTPSVATGVVPVLMPQAGNSMEEGTIVKWHVKEGDRIKKGQVIFEIETDKANMEVEATEDGRLAKIVTPVGGVQKVKEAVAYLGEGEVNLASAPEASAAAASPAQPVREHPPVAAPVAPTAASVTDSGRILASPAAKKIAREMGLDIASVGSGSGPAGRILSTDLTRASAAVPAAPMPKPAPTPQPVAPAPAPATPVPASSAGVTRKKMSKMRKAIAANLAKSKQTIPHFYLRCTINADAMMAFYKAEKAKYPCSVNDVVVLALARAMMEFPAFRSKIDGDDVIEYPNANVGIAVGVEDGLTVPVLLGANQQNLQQIAANSKRIAEGARSGKLEGWGEGNFTVTNLGMFGVEEFSAIVNPPEPGILAVGAVREAVVVKDGAMKAGKVMTMTISCDHRIIDGLLAAKFMARMKELLENPNTLA